MAAIAELIRIFNWLLAPDKMALSLLVKLKLLGFLLNPMDMLIRAPLNQREKLRVAAKDLVARGGQASARPVFFLQLALGLVCRLRSRYLMHAVAEAAGPEDYDRTVKIAGRAWEELLHWVDELDELPESFMHEHLRVADCVLHFDASNHALVVIVVQAP